MLFANCFLSFVSDGARTFHDAAMGKYHHESEAIQQLREELLGKSSITGDTQNLRRDRMNVGHDVRISFKKIVAQHE